MHPLLRILLIASAAGVFADGASAQCSFSISPQSATFPASGGNGVITITASQGSCARSVSSNVSWITISFGQTGTGSGTAGYTVLANNTNQQRTGALTVAGQVFTVTQSAGTCQYQLAPSSASVASSGGSGSFEVTSACSWTASTTASWITLTGGSGAGNGTVGWTAAANTSGSSRTGTIMVGGSTFTLTQAGACVVTLSASVVQVAASGGTGSVNVTANSNCAWTAAATVPWITLTGTTSDTGNGAVSFSVAANADSSLRVGAIVIGGATLTIQQQASTCTVLLNPPRLDRFPQVGGTGTFTVNATCAWTATSLVSWISITGGATGSGTGTVTFAVGPNYTSSTRGGAIAVNNSQFVVEQNGVPCEVYLDELEAVFSYEGGTGSFRFGAMRDCAWRASTTADWIRITSDSGGEGEGAVAFTVLPNPAIQVRTGIITVANRAFTVRQAAAPCTVQVGVRAVDIPAAGGSGSVPITANCRWQAVKSADWIQISSPVEGNADATLAFTVPANPSTQERRGTITVNGQAVTVAQAGQHCSLALSAAAVSLPARGGSTQVNVTGGAACSWSASSAQDWLQVEWSSAGGSGVVRLSAPPNTSGSDRVATVSVSGQMLSVRQPAIVIRLSADEIVNAASFRPGAVAPGELVTIYGTGFGPPALVTAQPTGDQRSITTLLSGTRVLFDGVAAPVLYAADGQLSAVVPYAVWDKQTTAVEVEYLGVRSNAVMLPVAAASPAIFSVGATGRGQGAIRNQDGTVNGAGNPAAPGSVVQIFATGEGRTRPDGVDGRLAVAPPLPAPLLPVRVWIGGVEAQVTYAGAAPGMVAGVMQVNARVPEGIVPGDEVPVLLRVGAFESPETITLAIR